MTDLNLHETNWDCCIIGNGVVALWLAHAQWAARKSVLWITSEEPYSSERAFLQHGWLWDANAAQAEILRAQVAGGATREDAGAELQPFELTYFDAKSSRRFRRLGEVKSDWGSHERAYFEAAAADVSNGAFDLWDWHSRLHAFHDSGPSQGFALVELATEPRFVRVQDWPVFELKTEGGRICGATLAGPGDLTGKGKARKSEAFDIRAEAFFLGDFDASLPSLIKNEKDSDALAGALKGKSYRAGFGLRLQHDGLETAPSQTMIVPLVVSPEKDMGSHISGRFVRTGSKLESFWFGFLTDEELEDNNEILKKIKQTKRAVERAVPGFADSISREAVTFVPRMRALSLTKNRKTEALGAGLFSDHYGPQVAVETFQKISAKGTNAKPAPKTSKHPQSPEAEI